MKKSLFVGKENFNPEAGDVEPVSTDVETLQTENAELQTNLDETELDLAETELDSAETVNTELSEDIQDIEAHVEEVEAAGDVAEGEENPAEFATERLRIVVARTARKHKLKAPASIINLSKEGYASLRGAERKQSLEQTKAFVALLKTGLETSNGHIAELKEKVATLKAKAPAQA